MILSLIANVYILSKLARFWQWLLSHKGKEINYSKLPDFHIFKISEIINKNKTQS